MLIDTKQKFYDLAEQGRVANTPKTWGSAFEWVSSGEFEKLRNFGIRSKSVSNPLCFPGLDRYDVLPTLVENRIEEGSYVITAAPPCQNEPFHCLQGELMYKDNIFYLYYTHKWGYMRKMLADHGRHAYGAKVTSLLSRFCDFESKKNAIRITRDLLHAGTRFDDRIYGFSAGSSENWPDGKTQHTNLGSEALLKWKIQYRIN